MKIEAAKKYIVEESLENPSDNPYAPKIIIDTETVLETLDKLDPPKPVVPQCIYELIKYHKEHKSTLYDAMLDVDNDEVNEWFAVDELNRQDHFAQAWLAYPNITVEKEKLYTVEIPNPNSDLKLILVKVNEKLKLIEVYEDQLEEYKNIRSLTKAEICKDFEWAWRWKKEVPIHE